MNPSFPIQRPGVVSNNPNSLMAEPHLSQPSHPASAQWATLNTNPDLQRTLCKAAAAGQLTPEQMSSFVAYMKGNQTAYKMFQLEIQAQQQQQIHLQQHQQADHDQLSSQHAHQMVNLANGFAPPPPSSSQTAIQMSAHLNPYQPSQQSSIPTPQTIPQRVPDPLSLMTGDHQLTQTLAQFRQAQEIWKNSNLSASERESAGQRARELRDVLAARMNQLGLRRDLSTASPSPAATAAATPAFQPAGQTGQPQHPNDVQRAQLTAAYQRQQQMMSGMPLASQTASGMTRSLTNNFSAVSGSSPRPNMNLSGRSSPAPNGNNTPGVIHNVSRPGSSHQPVVGPVSSPPAMQNSTSPPNNTHLDLPHKRRVASRPPPSKKQAVGTPTSTAASPLAQPSSGISPRPGTASLPNNTNPQPTLSSNLAPAATGPPSAALAHHPPHSTGQSSLSPPPATIEPSLTSALQSSPAAEANAKSDSSAQPTSSGPSQPVKLPLSFAASSVRSQQYTAIAAQQQHTSSQGHIPPVPAAVATSASTHVASSQPTKENFQPQPASPVPAPFPPPRPTFTGGHATSSTLAGPLLHRPPTNGIGEAMGQSSGSHDSSSRGQDVTSTNRIVSKRKIQELVESIDPSERLEAEVEDLLLELADEFIDSVTRFSCQLAKHRKSDRLETKDIQLHLERSWNIRIPGFANDEIRQSQSRRINALPSYQARVGAVREAAKKRRPAGS